MDLQLHRAVVWLRQQMGIENVTYAPLMPLDNAPGDPDNEIEKHLIATGRITPGA